MKKTEEKHYADDIYHEACKRWGFGWRLLSENQQKAECALIFQQRIISQLDSQQPIEFFQLVARALSQLFTTELTS